MFEIERKFLVADLPDLRLARPEPIRQGYITHPEDSVAVRLRQKGEACFMTVKGQGALKRSEHEVGISRTQFEALWPATEGRRVEKTRWTGPLVQGAVGAPTGLGAADRAHASHGSIAGRGDVYELDVFSGALEGLRLVEVEFSTVAAAEAFVPPAWFGRDVTGERRFSNRGVLCVEGRP